MPIPPPSPRRGVAAAGAPGGSGLGMLQGMLLVVAVLYFARDLLIPIVLAVLLAFVLAPVARGFRRVGVPRAPGVLLAVLIGVVAVLGIGVLMARQAANLAENLPFYRAAITEKLDGLQARGGLIDRITDTLSEMGAGGRQGAGQEAPPAHAAAPPPGDLPAPPRPAAAAAAAAGAPATQAAAVERQTPTPVVIREPDPTTFETLRRLAGPLLHPLATAGIVLILVIFILLYQEDLRDRLIRLAGARDLHRTMAAMDDAAYRLSRFFLAQVIMNAAYGALMAALLWLLGVPNPVLWGFLAGLMRFVPFVGSFIAAAPPLLLALAVDPGWTTAVLVSLLYVVGEAAMGQVVEPLVFGQSTGLSPIAVIAAATFWTWLWGPVGLLMATPLTVCLVVLGRHVDRLEFLEVMLGDQPALDPEETFYQRALAGDLDALAEQSERLLKERRVEEYLDGVALPALRLAQIDAQREAVAPERLDQLRQSVLALLEDLEEAEEHRPTPAPAAGDGEDGTAAATAAAPPPPPDWRDGGAVLCLAGRGPFDALLAAMLAQVLAARGFGVQLGGDAATRGGPTAAQPRLACLCLLEGGASAAATRYLLRRARRRLAPGVPVLALAWRPAESTEGPLATGLRAEGATARVLLAGSLTEAVDLLQDTANPGPDEAREAAAAVPAPANDPSSAAPPVPGDAALPGPAPAVA